MTRTTIFKEMMETRHDKWCWPTTSCHLPRDHQFIYFNRLEFHSSIPKIVGRQNPIQL